MYNFWIIFVYKVHIVMCTMGWQGFLKYFLNCFFSPFHCDYETASWQKEMKLRKLHGLDIHHMGGAKKPRRRIKLCMRKGTHIYRVLSELKSEHKQQKHVNFSPLVWMEFPVSKASNSDGISPQSPPAHIHTTLLRHSGWKVQMFSVILSRHSSTYTSETRHRAATPSEEMTKCVCTVWKCEDKTDRCLMAVYFPSPHCQTGSSFTKYIICSHCLPAYTGLKCWQSIWEKIHWRTSTRYFFFLVKWAQITRRLCEYVMWGWCDNRNLTPFFTSSLHPKVR